MVSELKRRIESGRVFLGIKESLKNMQKLDKIMVAADCRREVIDILKNKSINVEILEVPKEELANKLELGFQCEVFGFKK